MKTAKMRYDVGLRRLEEKDAEGMLEWMQDPEIQKSFCFHMEEQTRESVLEFIKSAGTEFADGRDVHYAIVNNLDEYLGTISLKNIDRTAGKAEYAISLRRGAQGKGIAAEATHAILQVAFEQHNLQKVYLNVLSENKRAIRLYEKCGFVYEGEFRRHLFLRGEYRGLKWYSMLREEYFAIRDLLNS